MEALAKQGIAKGKAGPGPGLGPWPFLKQFLAWQVPPLVFWAFAPFIILVFGPELLF